MASSTPSRPLGECVVCGKLCSKGCSSCKTAGLDWMYFCSVDHQRLVRRTHHSSNTGRNIQGASRVDGESYS
ncbi:hypothetical protein JCM5350_005630 [Sporobolomyces pararoseus]